MHGLYLEGAGWNKDELCLIRQKPKQLIQELPILKIIPIEAHRLKLQVCFYQYFSLCLYVQPGARNNMPLVQHIVIFTAVKTTSFRSFC